MLCHYIQVQSDEYSFLLYDSFERNMKGNEQKTCHGNEKLHVSNFYTFLALETFQELYHNSSKRTDQTRIVILPLLNIINGIVNLQIVKKPNLYHTVYLSPNSFTHNLIILYLAVSSI